LRAAVYCIGAGVVERWATLTRFINAVIRLLCAAGDDLNRT